MYRNTCTNVAEVNLNLCQFIKPATTRLLQIKERNFIDKFKPKLNKIWTVHTPNKNKETHIRIRTYIYNQFL